MNTNIMENLIIDKTFNYEKTETNDDCNYWCCCDIIEAFFCAILINVM